VIGGGSRGVVQARRDGRWVDVGHVRARAGRYRYAATEVGTYRVVFDGAFGPSVRL
jgi:stage II sporulation protein D